MKTNVFYNMDCLEGLKQIEDKTIDCIITDPPYLYLNHKLDRAFDEEEFFKQCYRVLKDDSFICFFGFGLSWHKWNIICNNLGFKHKEDIVWDKSYNSTVFNAISRVHENISILAKGNPTFNEVRIDYLEDRIENNNLVSIINDIKRVLGDLKKIKDCDSFLKWKNEIKISKVKHCLTTSKNSKETDTATRRLDKIQKGLKVKSIVRVGREHYQAQHPTQKPEKLIKILIKLLSKENDIILDPFTGSGTTLKTALELKRRYIGYEIDEEYFKIIEKRLSKVQQGLFEI